MTKSILWVIWDGPADIGRLREKLAAAPGPACVRQPTLGHPLPRPSEVAGAVFVGGAAAANDDRDPAILTALRWMDRALDVDAPIFATGLGARLAARALGGAVRALPEGIVERGYRPSTPTADGATLFPQEIDFLHWRSESFETPRGATTLATGRLGDHAFSTAEGIWAFEFRPEATLDDARRWRRAAEGATPPGADPDIVLAADDARCAAGVTAWLNDAFDAWLDR